MVASIYMDNFEKASDEHVRRERAKAREMKLSQWWKQQLGKGICYHCEQKFKKEDLTMDHLIPISRGGKTSKHNVVVACKPCNTSKKYYTQAELRMQELAKSSKADDEEA